MVLLLAMDDEGTGIGMDDDGHRVREFQRQFGQVVRLDVMQNSPSNVNLKPKVKA